MGRQPFLFPLIRICLVLRVGAGSLGTGQADLIFLVLQAREVCRFCTCQDGRAAGEGPQPEAPGDPWPRIPPSAPSRAAHKAPVPAEGPDRVSGPGCGEAGPPGRHKAFYLWLWDGGMRQDTGRTGTQRVLGLLNSSAQSRVGHRLGNRTMGRTLGWGRHDLGPRSGHYTTFSPASPRFTTLALGDLHFACCDNSASSP